MSKIDLDFFEKIIFQQSLKQDDNIFSASCMEYMDKALFRDPDIGAIMEIIKNFYVERDAIPTITELKTRINTAALKGHLKSAVDSIRGLDAKCNEQELMDNTEYFLKQRKFDNLIEKIIDEKLAKKEINLEDAQKESEKIHSISLIDNLGLDYFGDREKVEEYILRQDVLISTGYKGLDDAFGGGFMREGKAIYDIGGETNVGKSIFLANIAVNLIRNNEHVIIISPEMSEMRYAKRISGILTGIALATLPDNIANFKEYIDDFVSDHIAKLIIKEVATKSISPRGIRAYIQKLVKKKQFDPTLIAIDGHALLKPGVTQPTKHGELQFIVQECRGLSYTFNAPLLTVAQLNRTSHKSNNPGLDTLAGSWDSIADMDGHVNIWQTDEDREANMIRYAGKKARDGMKGAEGGLTIDYDTLRLIDNEHYETSDTVKNENAPINVEDFMDDD